MENKARKFTEHNIPNATEAWEVGTSNTQVIIVTPDAIYRGSRGKYGPLSELRQYPRKRQEWHKAMDGMRNVVFPEGSEVGEMMKEFEHWVAQR